MPITILIHNKDVTRHFNPINDDREIIPTGEGIKADIMPKIIALAEDYQRIGNDPGAWCIEKYVGDAWKWYYSSLDDAYKHIADDIQDAIYFYSTLLYELKDRDREDYEIFR